MEQFPQNPSPADTASKDVESLLMTSVTDGKTDQVENILRHESVSDTVLTEAMRYAVHLQHEEIALTFIRYSPNGHKIFKHMFSLMKSEYQEGVYRWEFFWIFYLLYKQEEKDLAMYAATASPPNTQQCILSYAYMSGCVDLAKAMICQVDPSAFAEKETLLEKAFRHFDQNKEQNLVRLCVSSGLSTFHRNANKEFSNPLYFAFFRSSLQTIKLLVESGCCTNKVLHEFESHGAVQEELTQYPDEKRTKCFRYIQEAAATPCRLQHLARLTISHSIGCRPGRSQRIQALPLPGGMKQYLGFRDVLGDDMLF